MMRIDEVLLESILENYPISDWSDFEYLESGFHSDNVKISTDYGDLVVRQIFDDPLSINRMMFIYDFLSSHDFPTATPIQTIDGKYITTLVDQHYVVQQFVGGAPPLTDTREQAIEISEKVGQAIGRLHTLLQDMNMEEYQSYSPNYQSLDIISWLKRVELGDDGIYFPKLRKTLDDEYVVKQYREWLKELSDMDLDSLQQGICHNDLKLADFRFEDGKLVGLLDLGSAEFSYHLYDIAGYMMYTNLYTETIAEMFFSPFIRSYLAASKMTEAELAYLPFFLKARFLLQVFYFFHRIHSGDTQGVESSADNVGGMQDGISYLETLDRIPDSFYTDLLDR